MIARASCLRVYAASGFGVRNGKPEIFLTRTLEACVTRQSSEVRPIGNGRLEAGIP